MISRDLQLMPLLREQEEVLEMVPDEAQDLDADAVLLVQVKVAEWAMDLPLEEEQLMLQLVKM
jgi:uncharacterized protein YbjQ (UPF0145 family)